MTRLSAGDAVYIRNKNTRLLDRPALNGVAISTLQPGAKVTWRGAAAGGQFHEIEATGRKGYTHFSNLSLKPALQYVPQRPDMEDCPQCINGMAWIGTPGVGMQFRPCPACAGKGTVAKGMAPGNRGVFASNASNSAMKT